MKAQVRVYVSVQVRMRTFEGVGRVAMGKVYAYTISYLIVLRATTTVRAREYRLARI